MENIDIKKTIQNLDFEYYGVNFEYDNVQSENHHNICAGDYCRCSHIESSITSVDHITTALSICKAFNITNDATKSQILKVCEKLTVDDFEVNVIGGYYGEETNGVSLVNYSIIIDLENIIDLKKARKEKIKKLDLSSKESDYIRKILVSEYGYLLESLKNSTFSIIEVETKDIVFPSKIQSDNVKKKYLYSYRKHKICGIVRESNGKYKVIDGYHRITSNLNRSTIKVILSENN